MISKFYNRNIAEGKGFLVFAIIFAILIRLVYILHPEIAISVDKTEGGYLWELLIPIFEQPTYSIIGSSLSIILIAFMVNYINIEHALIRIRTLLPVGIVILLFSCVPWQLAMSTYYIGVVVMLLIVNCLFRSYNATFKQEQTYKASFYLSLGSLFTPGLLLYFPVLWICLARMRSFSFKAFLASLFSIFVIYVPTLSYFYFTESIDGFLKPFVSLSAIRWDMIPVLHYDLHDYITLAIATLLILLILIDYSINSFKDKIRARAFLSVLTIVSLVSFLCVILLNLDTKLALYIALAIGSLQIAHYFSLAQNRVTAVVFFLFLLLLMAISTISFLIL